MGGGRLSARLSFCRVQNLGVRLIQPEPTPPFLTISWLTDIHLDEGSAGLTAEAPGAIRHDVLYIYTGRSRLQKFVDSVNKELPDLTICTGDLIDSYGLYLDHHLTNLHQDEGRLAPDVDQPDPGDAWLNLMTFKKHWQAIEATVPTAITIGNHDLMALPRHNLIKALGYADQSVIAGSPINYAVSISNGATSARVLMLDTTVGTDPERWGYTGRLLAEAQEWIGEELASCSENIVLLCMHHGPHAYDQSDPLDPISPITQFDRCDATRLRSVVDRAAAGRPMLKVYCLFGHYHTSKKIRYFSNLGPNLPGYLGPCAIDFDPGLYSKIRLYPDGSLKFEVMSL